MQIRSKIAVLFFFVSFNAVAACEKGSTTVFSCVTGKGKIIEVCDSKKTIDYSFGKPSEKPDLALKVPRESASTTQWNGMGRWISYSVEIPNGNTVDAKQGYSKAYYFENGVRKEFLLEDELHG